MLMERLYYYSRLFEKWLIQIQGVVKYGFVPILILLGIKGWKSVPPNPQKVGFTSNLRTQWMS